MYSKEIEQILQINIFSYYSTPWVITIQSKWIFKKNQYKSLLLNLDYTYPYFGRGISSERLSSDNISPHSLSDTDTSSSSCLDCLDLTLLFGLITSESTHNGSILIQLLSKKIEKDVTIIIKRLLKLHHFTMVLLS